MTVKNDENGLDFILKIFRKIGKIGRWRSWEELEEDGGRWRWVLTSDFVVKVSV